MSTSVPLDPETEARLDELAAATGRNRSSYLDEMRELVRSGLEDMEDAYLAAQALERHLASGEPSIPLEDLVRELGLAD